MTDRDLHTPSCSKCMMLFFNRCQFPCPGDFPPTGTLAANTSRFRPDEHGQILNVVLLLPPWPSIVYSTATSPRRRD
jgi:hypothetical protein